MPEITAPVHLRLPGAPDERAERLALRARLALDVAELLAARFSRIPERHSVRSFHLQDKASL